jgi:glycosyltransferase involved in cell wall biosynthesis
MIFAMDKANQQTDLQPLVSVVMGTYNGERFLRQQLDSIIAQDYRPLEVIVCDDCSTDGSWAILQEYAKRHNFIQAHRNATNLGMIENYQNILRMCSGEFIALCDHDDIWLPTKISTQVREIGSASLCYSRLSYIDENGTPLPEPARKTNRLEGRCPLALLFHNCVAGNVTLIRRDILKFALPIPHEAGAPDHWIAFIAATAGGLQASEKITSLYRIHGSNVSVKKRDQPRKSWLTRIRERRKLFTKKQTNRLAVLRNTKRLEQLLTEEENRMIGHLTDEIRKLDRCFFNFRLFRLFRAHSDLLLPVYRKPRKMAIRFALGKYFYEAVLYSRKP